jgi:hypothetical protein
MILTFKRHFHLEVPWTFRTKLSGRSSCVACSCLPAGLTMTLLLGDFQIELRLQLCTDSSSSRKC